MTTNPSFLAVADIKPGLKIGDNFRVITLDQRETGGSGKPPFFVTLRCDDCGNTVERQWSHINSHIRHSKTEGRVLGPACTCSRKSTASIDTSKGMIVSSSQRVIMNRLIKAGIDSVQAGSTSVQFTLDDGITVTITSPPQRPALVRKRGVEDELRELAAHLGEADLSASEK